MVDSRSIKLDTLRVSVDSLSITFDSLRVTVDTRRIKIGSQRVKTYSTRINVYAKRVNGGVAKFINYGKNIDEVTLKIRICILRIKQQVVGDYYLSSQI
jgi:hypothetical protein